MGRWRAGIVPRVRKRILTPAHSPRDSLLAVPCGRRAAIDDPFYRDWLRDSARLEFRNNCGETDESEIKVMISRGKQQLAETKSMISQATRGV